jgi:CHRD domain
MRRIPILLALIVSALAVMSGSALAAVTHLVASPPANNSLPTIGGAAREGQTLTATSGSWGGTTPISYAYQWQRCNSAGSSCASIGKATSQNYVVSHTDVNNTIRVEVTATNADGTSQALSAATVAIAPLSGSAPANTKQPDPSGTAQDGQTVKVDSGSWSGLKPITFTYQWQSCTAVNPVCTNLAGVTGSSFLIGASQIGTLLRATVTATNSSGNTSVSSNLTAAVIAKAGSPVNTSLPRISGTPSVGQRLQASTGSWTGLSTSDFGYEWTRCNANGSACSGISGATGQSYGVGQADLGMALRVSVTAKNSTGSTIATSAASRIGATAVKTSKYSAVLRTGQEVIRPKGTPASAAGHLTARLSGRTLSWTLTFSHLSGRPTVARLHKGFRGTNGVAIKVLCRYCTSPRYGTLTLTASQRDSLLRGRTYVNVYTARNMHGEIRGQITRVS